MRTCATARRVVTRHATRSNSNMPLPHSVSLLPPPPPFFSPTKRELNAGTTDGGPTNLMGPPAEGARYRAAAVVTSQLSFFFFCLYFSHLFELVGNGSPTRVYHVPAPHLRGATALPHATPRHNTQSRRHAKRRYEPPPRPAMEARYPHDRGTQSPRHVPTPRRRPPTTRCRRIGVPPHPFAPPSPRITPPHRFWDTTPPR